MYGLFTASGAAALAYQVLWSRWLALSFGATTASVSVVLGCFMAGLAIGSAAAGRFMPRIGNPMRAYAAVELAIGLYAAAFPILVGPADALFSLLAVSDSPAPIAVGLRAVFAFALLAVPTTLMGATLPLLAEHFRRDPTRTGSFKPGVLYAANTLGAALGILATAFFLIELAGVRATTLAAAAVNLLVAAIGFRLSSGAPERGGRVPTPGCVGPPGDRGSTARPAEAPIALVALTVGGAVALASEVLWTRVLETVVGNSTYAFATIVLVYLVGIASGSGLMSLGVGRIRRRSLGLACLMLAMGIWTIASVFLLDGLSGGFAHHAGRMVGMGVHLVAYGKAVLVLLPLAMASGACFPLAARMLDPAPGDPGGAAVARACAWNTVGAVAGALLAGFAVAPRFEFFGGLYLLATAYGLAALAVLAAAALRDRDGARKSAFPILAAGLALAVVAASLSGASGESRFVRRLRARDPFVSVPFHEPGLQGVVTVVRRHAGDGSHRDRDDSLLVNGVGMTRKATDTKLMAHLPMLLHPRPLDTLVVCFGMGTTYRSALSHGGNVTAVELSREVLDAFPFFHADAARVLASPKGRMVVNDGRNYLKLARGRFDVITLDPPPPIDSAGVVNLYSREFVELAKSRLKKGGILAHWYPLPGTQSGVDDPLSLGGLVATFAQAFPHVYVKRSIGGIGLHLLGSSEPIDPDPAGLARRLGDPAVAADLGEWDPVPASFFREIPPLEGRTSKMRPLTDDDPWLEFHLLRTLRSGGGKLFPVRAW